MTKDEIIEKLERCIEKANLLFKVSSDEDEYAEFVVTKDSFYYDGDKTPYKPKDFSKIKYYVDPTTEEYSEENFIRIYFMNGDSLTVQDYGYPFARIDNEFYRGCKEVSNAYKRLSSQVDISYSPQEVLNLISVCLDKAGIYGFVVQNAPDDEDRIVDIGFENGRLFIDDDVETIYSAEDVASIRFYSGHEYDEPDSVIIDFKNGERLTFNEYGTYRGYILDGKLMHSYCGIDALRRRFSLEIKARAAAIADNEFVVIDGTLFKYNGDSKEIVLPEGIVSIEPGVFENSPIEKLTCPESLKSIGSHAFRSCKYLHSVELNDGLEVIGNRAFCACESLKYIELPPSLKIIEECAFLHSKVRAFNYIPEGCTVSEKCFDI